MFGKKQPHESAAGAPRVRDDLARAADRVRGDAPRRGLLPQLSTALDQLIDEDEYIHCVLRGNVSPSIIWVCGTRTFVRFEESLTGNLSGTTLSMAETGRIISEPTVSGFIVGLLASDGSLIDKIRIHDARSALSFAADHRVATRPELCGLIAQTQFDCAIPMSMLLGTSVHSVDLVVGESYEVGFSADAVAFGDAAGPLLAFGQTEVTGLEITGPQQVYHPNQIETRVILSTPQASVVLVNQQLLPQDLHAQLLPQFHRLNAGGTPKPNSASLTEELTRLAALRDAGHLTESEYATAKKRLLQ